MRLKPHVITFSVPNVKSETTCDCSNNIDHQTKMPVSSHGIPRDLVTLQG